MSEIVKDNGNLGSVLVVGGGIAGIQSALDLAESGYYVYLLEPSPAIGGRMAQLDKTFPTNDCAMCIISPKLVECGRHLNIEIITYADLLKVKGEPENFNVEIRKRAKSVDEPLCTGCGSCWNNCPVRNKIYLQKEEGVHKEITDVPSLDDVKLDEVEELLKGYQDGDESLLIPILQETQKAYGYLPEKALERIAEYVDVSLSHIYGLVTFYTQFYLTPRGRNIVRVCRGTACHVRGGTPILRAVQNALGIKEGETTSDFKFSLETVACFGTCFLSPVIMVNNDYYGKLLPENVDTILEQYD